MDPQDGPRLEDTLNRIAGIAILVVGIALLGWGLAATHSLGSSVSKLFTGAPTDRSIFLVLGGGLLTAVGAGTLFYPEKP